MRDELVLYTTVDWMGEDLNSGALRKKNKVMVS